jgi:predicted flavoprotein YhiN
MDFDTLIIGAGAAGLICAAQAPGKCVVIDHAKPRARKFASAAAGGATSQIYMRRQKIISASIRISPNPHWPVTRNGISSIG